MSDPQAWFLTTQALDHHATAQALNRAVQGQLGEALAEDVAAGLARAGYALVLVRLENPERTDDLSDRVDTFLARKQD